MSDEIVEMLKRAGEDGGDPLGFGGADVVRLGRARRRRRRVVGGSSTALGLAAAAVAALAVWPSITDDRSDAPVIDTPTLSEQEILRRCTRQLAQDEFAGRKDWHILRDFGDFHAPDDPVALSEGSLVSLRAPNDGISALCTVPQLDRLDQEPVWNGTTAEPDQADAIRRQCTAVSGFDFADWDVASAHLASDSYAIVATLVAMDGRSALCYVSPSIDEQYVHVPPTPEDTAERIRVAFLPTPEQFDRRRDEFLFLAYGRLPADAYDGAARIRLDLPDGTTQMSPVQDGRYALLGYSNSPRLEPLTVTVLDAAGNVVDTYEPESEWLADPT
jgi:hypothetical protein